MVGDMGKPMGQSGVPSGRRVKGVLGGFRKGTAAMPAWRAAFFVDVPCIRGSISSKMRRILIEGGDGLTIQGAERRQSILVERLGLFGENHIPRVRSGGSGDARTVAPEEFVLLFLFGSLGVLWWLGGFGRRTGVIGSVF